MSYIYETELDELCERFSATVEIKYSVDPGEKMVRYYPDGSGYPGSPPSIELERVTVTSLSGETWDKDRAELEASGFAKQIDDAAWEEVERLIDGHWLADHLFSNAEPEPYD